VKGLKKKPKNQPTNNKNTKSHKIKQNPKPSKPAKKSQPQNRVPVS